MAEKIGNAFFNKRVLVVGLGVSGQSAALFLRQQGALVVGVDCDDSLLSSDPIDKLRLLGVECYSEKQILEIKSFDTVVISPGIPQTHFLYQAASKAGMETIGEVELAFQFLDKTVVGITGTNGKTTVTLLIEHVLNHSGCKAKALGNVGFPLTQALDSQVKNIDVFVVELSSFQLETLKSPLIDLGIILNISPDHLDRYPSFEDYAKTKIRLHSCLKPKGNLYLEEKTFLTHQHLFQAKENLYTYGYSSTCDFHTDLTRVISNRGVEFVLPKKFHKPSHDLENLLGAYALCSQLGISGEQFCHAVSTFKKPPHRIEFVKTVNGVHYYDDSKGTNIDAVIRAIESIPGKIVLIAGGVDKGSPYSAWIAPFTDKVKEICAIGQAAPKIKIDLEDNFPVHLFQGMEDAVKFASKMALPGDSVLLSPGCSSFDMYKSYAHRGEEFQRIVNVL